ncbi:MAG: sugar phosphate isomerase/epimerase [Deltaproteobacteria bacterium]
MTWTIHSTVPFPLLEEPETIPLLARCGVGPEIYLSAGTLDALIPSRVEAAAAALAAAGIGSLTLHGPFEDLSPGARDEEARRLTVRRFREAIGIAGLLRARGVVLHGGYSEWLYDFRPDLWLEPARRTFSEAAEAAERADTNLYLENVFDEVPDHLLRLREAVSSPRIGFCFDPGHATLFSRLPVQKWVEALAPALGEMHLHDNRGLRDDHLPAGEGTINLRGVVLAARDEGTRPILTVEPHRREHFPRAVDGLRAILASLP